MTPEQMLIVAREFCAARRVRIVRFDALVAGAAAASARIDGIPVHGSPRAAAGAMAEVLTKLGALSDLNEEFARICSHIYLSVTEDV